MVGWQPWPDCTVRELLKAVEIRQRSRWDHTASLLSMMANLHATGKYTPYQFHPMMETPKLAQDDPAATYRWLKAQEAERNGWSHNQD